MGKPLKIFLLFNLCIYLIFNLSLEQLQSGFLLLEPGNLLKMAGEKIKQFAY